MNSISLDSFHSEFQLNNITFDIQSLLQKADLFIEKGADFEKQIGHFLNEWFDDSDHITAQSSGTTGIPKTIQISKQAMVESARATGVFFSLKPGNTALLCLSTQYIAGKMMLVRALVLGLKIDCIPPSSNPLETIEKNYDFAAMVPMQAQNSIAKLNSIKTLIIGGTRINPGLQNSLLKLKTAVFETFGMTETITHFAARRIGEEAFSLLPNIEISKDERDCLVIHAPRISDKNIVTNDLVSIFSETQFVYLGRIDSVVNSGGVKLFPEQIENKLATEIPSRFFVIGVPDPTLGEKLILVVEGEKFDIQETIFQSLNAFEKPKEIHFVFQFIETETGKINRNKTLIALKL